MVREIQRGHPRPMFSQDFGSSCGDRNQATAVLFNTATGACGGGQHHKGTTNTCPPVTPPKGPYERLAAVCSSACS